MINLKDPFKKTNEIVENLKDFDKFLTQISKIITK